MTQNSKSMQDWLTIDFREPVHPKILRARPLCHASNSGGKDEVLPQLLEALADGNLAPAFNRATKAMSAKQSRIFSSDRRSDFANSDVW
jgi:hypothetical protein